MLALFRCGRAAEALDCYTQIRRRLGDELGVEPTPALDALQQQILRQDPALLADPAARRDAPRAGYRPPRQLPADIAAFAGRHAELATLDTIGGGATPRRPWSSRPCPAPPGSARPPWPCTGRTGSPTGFPTGSCTSTSAVSTRRVPR
nr:hypothetical protein GCM10020092_077820 [Actinoplanes digitatis]